MFIVLHTDTCCRVAAGGDVVWHGSITSPDVTTFSASVHQISGSMKYLKHVSFSVMSYKLSVSFISAFASCQCNGINMVSSLFFST